MALDDEHHLSHRLALLFIIAIGFLLRAYSLEVGEAFRDFTINDEISAFIKAFEFLTGQTEAYYIGQPAFAGGRAPGPLWTLFTVGAYYLGGQTIYGALWVMVFFSSITLYLVYRLALLFTGPRLALLTVLLFATAPAPVYYAVGFYNPMPLAFFSALLFIALHRVIFIQHSRHIFWVVLVMAILPQFHMMAVFYIPPLLVLFFITRIKLNWRWFGLGVLAGITLYVPYFIGDSLNNWQNTLAMLEGTPREFSFSVMKILTTPAAAVSNVLGRMPGDEFSQYQALGNRYFIHYSVLVAINLFSLLLCLWFFFYFGYKFFRHIRGWLFNRADNTSERVFALFGSLVYLPLLLFLATGHNYATRYAIIIFPLLFLLPVLAISTFKKPRLILFLTRSFLFICLINIYIVTSLFNYKSDMLKSSPEFMPSFATLAQIEQEITREQDEKVHYQVEYSSTIQALPEDQYKLYRAVEYYLNRSPLDTQHSVQLVFDIPHQETTSNGEVVYTSRHLVIKRIE